MLDRPFTEYRQAIQKFRDTGNLKYVYRNKVDKDCCAHDVAYSDSKDLATRTISDKIAKDRCYEIARDCKYYGYKRALAGMVYRFFVKKQDSN